MSILFEPFDLCGLRLKNRIVRTATAENMATPERRPSPGLINLYEELARGGAGLITTSAVRADRTWDRGPHSYIMCLDRDDLVPELARLAELIQAHGAKAVMQLGVFFNIRGQLAGPSSVPYSWAPGAAPRALTVEDIREIVLSYGLAGERARKAGFDAVQIHAAHGFPLGSFLSPLFNRRRDEYGGDAENRARLVSEITAAIKSRAGDDFPVFVKINVADFCPGGMTVEDAIETARILVRNGIGAIETSGGAGGREMTALGPAKRSEWREGYFMEYAAAIKAAVDVPIILVGGLRSPEMMAEVISQGRADLAGMSRPFINEPQIVKRWQSGDYEPSACISCNGCMQLFNKGQAVRCVNKDKSN